MLTLFENENLVDLGLDGKTLGGLEKLWALRALELLGGKRRFVFDHGFAEDELAQALGLKDFDDYGSKKAALAAIKTLHRQAEKEWGKELARWSKHLIILIWARTPKTSVASSLR